MGQLRLRCVLSAGLLLVNCAIAFRLEAGGSGLNTIVIVNQASTNSCDLGNYFCERRQVPPENVLRISWSGGNVSWSSGDFQTNLLDPLLTLLASRQLTNQIDYVVLSMDIPFQTVNNSIVNSTTSTLFYGSKTDSKSAENSYAASEGIFRDATPATAAGYSFLATMITADTLAHAEQLVDQGVASDGAYPSQPVILAKSSDPLRNIRYHAFDNAIFNTQIRGNFSMVRTNSDSPAGQTNLLGYQTGLANLSVSPGTFVPGAIADSLTSFGGIIFGPNGQTTLLAFINAGAAGSYGTVTEPGPDPEKFPDPQVYFYQSRGFSLAECYYQSVSVPFQGLVVGEPLAAPFARAASGKWVGVSSNALLSGTAQLSVQFAANDRDHPLQQIDLFVDGKYFKTLTNLPPRPGNRLNLRLNGLPINYTVPPNATIASVANDVASLLNAPSNAITTRMMTTLHGDRVELHSSLDYPSAGPAGLRLPVGPPGGSTALTPSSLLFVSSSRGTANLLSTFIAAPRNAFFLSESAGIKACSINGTIQTGTWLQFRFTKTNGVSLSLSVTNQTVGATLMDLAGQLVDSIGSATELQDADGVAVEDFNPGPFGSALFNLRARSPGPLAAAAKVNLSGSDTLVINPATQTALEDNLSDLEPRTHIYIAAGATNIALTFRLDTTALADGYHELAAVAYEGTHVRTQTRAAVPVRVHNTSLSATMTFLDLLNPAPVQGTYHVEVAANSSSIRTISLFSTGGLLNTTTNQASTVFAVAGSSLGAGLHPFYALVENTSGARYRTATQWIRLVR